MDHQKPTILLIFGTLSLGGCGGHPMRPKLNLKDKSQMSTPNEYTDNLKSNLICRFLSVRTKSKKPLCPRTQCTSIIDTYTKPNLVTLKGRDKTFSNFKTRCEISNKFKWVFKR